MLDTFRLLEDADLVRRFHELRSKRTALMGRIVQVEAVAIAPMQVEIDDLTATIEALEAGRLAAIAKDTPVEPIDDRLARCRADRKRAVAGISPRKAAVAAVKATLDAFDAFVSEMLTAAPSSYPRIVAAAVQACLHADGEDKVTHVLHVAVSSAGGETITRRHAFTIRPRITYVGGCQVSYLVLDVKSRAVRGGTSSWMATLRFDSETSTVSEPEVRRLTPATGGGQAPALPPS